MNMLRKPFQEKNVHVSMGYVKYEIASHCKEDTGEENLSADSNEFGSDTKELRPLAKLLIKKGYILAERCASRDGNRLCQPTIVWSTNDELKENSGCLHTFNSTQTQTAQHGCNYCSFATDSANVLLAHADTVHELPNGQFQCALCGFISANTEFLRHMYVEHSRCSKLEKRVRFVCDTCPAEYCIKSKYTKHEAQCRISFNSFSNQAPCPGDDDIPLKCNPRSVVLNNLISGSHYRFPNLVPNIPLEEEAIAIKQKPLSVSAKKARVTSLERWLKGI